jgi:hypothetical protein
MQNLLSCHGSDTEDDGRGFIFGRDIEMFIS